MLMKDSHDPNKTLKTSPIELTGGGKSVPVDAKLKKILQYLAGAVAVTIIALLVPMISILLVLSMPAAFGLAVYAMYLRYKAVNAAENQAPDWSKIKVAPKPEPEDQKDGEDTPPADHVTYNQSS